MNSSLITITEAAQIMRCSRVSVYARIHEGAFALRKMGRRSFILRSDVEKYIENLPIAALRAS